MNVYNIVWADDQIDELLEEDLEKELNSKGFIFVGKAHNGEELASCLRQPEKVDAVIVDANFNESSNMVGRERDTSGLDMARGLLRNYPYIPFFLYTGRTDELLLEKYQDNKENFLKDFPLNKRWFHKGPLEQQEKMFNEIKSAIEEMHSTYFIIRNRYKKELDACEKLFEGTDDFILDFLIRDYNNDFNGLTEPFVSVRRAIEKIFAGCKNLGLTPPIDNFNGYADYFYYSNYSPKINGERKMIFRMIDESIMPKPLAWSLQYIVDIIQDAAHSKPNLKLHVEKYLRETNDVLLIRSVVYILLDLIRWFVDTGTSHLNIEENRKLWEKVD